MSTVHAYRPVVWLAAMCCCAMLRSQDQGRIDSLHKAITAATHDTTRLAAMMALSELIGQQQPDTNMVLCKQALAIAERDLKQPDLKPVVRSALLLQQASALNNMAVSHFIFGQLDSALACFLDAERIHRENGRTDGVADALNNQGVVHEALGNHAEQRRCLFAALAIYEDTKEMNNVGKALNNIGNYYGGRGLKDSAHLYLDSSLKTVERVEDRQGIADAHLNLGRWYDETGQPAVALEHYLVSEPIYMELKDDRGLATCLNNIASIYGDQGILEEALNYYHRALDIHIAAGNRIDEANLRMNIGSVLDDQGELDMALEEFQKSLAIYTETGDRSGEALIHGHLGNLWKNKGDRKRALEHLTTSLAISRAIEDPDGISTALYKLGHYHEDVGQLDSALARYRECLAIEQSTGDRESESFTLYSIAGVKLKQGRAAEAEDFAERSLAIAKELGYPVNIMRATQVLNEALAKQGKWARALEMLELHEQMKDSVHSQESAKMTLRLQMRYAFNKRQLADSLEHVAEMDRLENERKVAELEAERLAQRNLAMAGGGVLLLLGGGVAYWIDRKRRRERFERDTARLQTQILRSQMNPHFIFNALNSINSYVQENDKELASGFLTRFARLMRLVLENSRQAEVPLAQDLEALRLYLDLERARLKEKFDYRFEVDPAIDQQAVMVPPLLVQPFVENAIWHGIARKEGRGHIVLTCRLHGDQLVMTVEDDGPGCSKEPPTTSPDPPDTKTSLGTSITRSRLVMLAQQKGGRADFRFVDLPQGLRVEVEMPVVRD